MINLCVGILITALAIYLTALFTTKVVLPECRSGYHEVLIPASFVYVFLFGLASLGYSMLMNY